MPSPCAEPSSHSLLEGDRVSTASPSLAPREGTPLSVQPFTRFRLLLYMFMHTTRSMAEDNPEAEIFRHCFPSRTPPPLEPGSSTTSQTPTVLGTPPQRQKRQRPDYQRQNPRGSQFATYHHQPQFSSPFSNPQERQQQQLLAMSKLLLQHEDRINNLNLDRGMVLFLKEDARSILPSMMKATKERNARKDQGDDRLTSPLRTVLLANMIKELQQRMQTISRLRREGHPCKSRNG